MSTKDIADGAQADAEVETADAGVTAQHLAVAAGADIRKELPRLMAALGVNTADEHAVFHAALIALWKVALQSSPELASIAGGE